MTRLENSRRRQLVLLVSLAVGMFGFAFALVPLYTIFCELTGLNGKTSGEATVSELNPTAASDREVTVQFLAKVARGMPWEFRPMERQLRVRPGEIYATSYFFRNRAGQTVIGQAVPSVAPGQAAAYLKKIECFCFDQQSLDAGEQAEMPVRFFIDTNLPEEISTVSLSYTLFRVSETPPDRLRNSQESASHRQSGNRRTLF